MRRLFWIFIPALIFANACKKDETKNIIPVIDAGQGDTIYVDESYTVTGASATAAEFIEWTHNGAGTLNNTTGLTPTYIPGLDDADKLVRITLSAWNDTTEVAVTDYIDLYVRSVADSLAMGAGYANDVYYSFANGIVGTAPRANWDIAFCTEIWNSTILTNGGTGVQLYSYPDADTNGWYESLSLPATISWPVMYNSDTTWTYGAFEAYSAGHPDYGWGIYNSMNHDVVGDSIFIISVPNPAGGDPLVKKIFIQKKHSTANTYYFKYANPDGSDAHEVELNCNDYSAKNFVYYSISGNAVVDREPAKESWDFVFSKYIAYVPTAYPVTGALINRGLTSAELIDPADPSTVDYSGASFSTNMSGIGSDWKSFNGASYDILNKLYFVKRADNNVYRLKFTGFAGSSSGIVRFERKQVN